MDEVGVARVTQDGEETADNTRTKPGDTIDGRLACKESSEVLECARECLELVRVRWGVWKCLSEPVIMICVWTRA